MRENVLHKKSFDFAVRIARFARFLREEDKEYEIARQVIRSGTAIGAMVREAHHAESNADFIHKLAIAQKEANETVYWIELCGALQLIKKADHDSIRNDALVLKKIITSIIVTLKENKRVG